MRRAALAVLIAILLAYSGTAYGSTNGPYSGTTGEHDLITLTVSGNAVTYVSYRAFFHCAVITNGPPSKTEGTMHSAHISITHGTFSGTIAAGFEDVITIKGTFKGKNVSGSFSETYHPDTVTCTTGTVSYSAAK